MRDKYNGAVIVYDASDCTLVIGVKYKCCGANDFFKYIEGRGAERRANRVSYAWSRERLTKSELLNKIIK